MKFVESSPATPFFKSCSGVVAPYASLLALLFGLFSAFMASEASNHNERARGTVTREADAIRVVFDIGDAAGEPGRTLRTLLADYGKASAGGDWDSTRQAAAAETKSLAMLREIMFGGLAAADAQVRQTAISSVTEIRGAYRERIALAHSNTAELKWLGAFILGILTQMAVVIVHLGKPRASMLATALFSLGMAFTLWVVLQRIEPFTGRYAVSVAPIVTAAMNE